MLRPYEMSVGFIGCDGGACLGGEAVGDGVDLTGFKNLSGLFVGEDLRCGVAYNLLELTHSYL